MWRGIEFMENHCTFLSILLYTKTKNKKKILKIKNARKSIKRKKDAVNKNPTNYHIEKALLWLSKLQHNAVTLKKIVLQEDAICVFKRTLYKSSV